MERQGGRDKTRKDEQGGNPRDEDGDGEKKKEGRGKKEDGPRDGGVKGKRRGSLRQWGEKPEGGLDLPPSILGFKSHGRK